jgi:exodeoxyribonuclease VII large subunit
MADAKPKIYSISELTRWIRLTLEKSVGVVWVEGEISNLHYHPSGHVYLTLKDAQSQLSAVMFRNSAHVLSVKLKDGMQVQACGRITVYEKRGNYQIILDAIQPAGLGNLQAAFDALKKKLETEGLFDPARKRPLPVFPETVGVVTSPSGAAIRDFGRVLHRRFPGLRIVVAPARVQGEGAAQEIADAIDLLNSEEVARLGVRVDVIAIIRGGGSLEDLWAFNEEVAARAVARSEIPTISGVGHEVDFTICDFVADVRAPTPSAAAEMLIRPKSELRDDVRGLAGGLHQAARLAISTRWNRLGELREKLREREPRQFIREWRLRLDDASGRLYQQTHRCVRQAREAWLAAAQRFEAANPRLTVMKKQSILAQIRERWTHHQVEYFSRLRHRLDLGSRRLELLSPKATLARGYSITQDAATGEIIRSIQSARRGQTLVTRLTDGNVESTVEKTQPS